MFCLDDYGVMGKVFQGGKWGGGGGAGSCLKMDIGPGLTICIYTHG